MAKYLPDPAVGIVGIGSDAPEQILSNEDLEKMVDTSSDWIIERTGIKTRRISDENTTTSTLATNAARRALEDAGVAAEEIDLIVVGTATPDMMFPSTACLVQAEIGAPNATAFDLSAACSGFLYGLNVAIGMIRNGTHGKALVIGAETLTKILDFEDRSTCVLFGDGAGAAVVQGVESGSGVLSFRLHADGSAAESLMLPGGGSKYPSSHETVDERLHFIKMNGNNVFKVGVRSMSDALVGGIEDAGLHSDDIDLFVPHQANIRIIDALAKRAGIAKERVFVNVDRYGNTSAASIPIALDEAKKAGRLKKGDVVAAVAFGAGYTWGSTIFRF